MCLCVCMCVCVLYVTRIQGSNKLGKEWKRSRETKDYFDYLVKAILFICDIVLVSPKLIWNHWLLIPEISTLWNFLPRSQILFSYEAVSLAYLTLCLPSPKRYMGGIKITMGNLEPVNKLSQ